MGWWPASRSGGRVTGQFTRPALSFLLLQRMHRVRGGLPSLISHSHTPLSISRQLRERSTSSSTKVTKTKAKATKPTWINSARTILNTAAFHRARSTPPKSRYCRELRLVNSILDEWSLPSASERGLQGVASPITSDLEECTSELPSGVDPGTLAEIRL